MIRIRNLSYTYPGKSSPALQDASIEFEPSSLVVVAGESASGKSTLLRSLNGLVPHFYGGRISGEVTVDGMSTLDNKPRDLADKVGFVGQVPEDHAIADRVEDDIAFTLENLGLDLHLMRKRVEEVLDALGLTELRDRTIRSLSGGERQRAAIASALVAMPAYLILDEPTSQLDPQSAEEVIAAILRLRDELGIGIVLAEQRLDRVLQYADSVVFMRNGSLESGEARALFADRGGGPPVLELGKRLGWSPLPLSLVEARRHARSLTLAERSRHEAARPSGTILVIQNARASLGGRRVLEGISEEVHAGEVLTVMGRNGSGKTTLLRAAAGLLEPESGKVERPPRIAFVPQDPGTVMFRPTLAEEIAETLRVRGCVSDRGAVEQEAFRFEVTHLLDANPLDLSGGERTWAAIAAMAAGDWDVILLDEPTRGLDHRGRAHLKAVLSEWRQRGRAAIIATHDVELAAEISDRVTILAGGRVISSGTPAETLAGSLTFSTQMNKVFGRADLLTVGDVMERVS